MSSLQNVLVTLPMLVIICFSILGNLLVVLSVLLVRALRKPSNILLLALAVTDLLVSLIVMPGAVFQQVSPLSSPPSSSTFPSPVDPTHLPLLHRVGVHRRVPLHLLHPLPHRHLYRPLPGHLQPPPLHPHPHQPLDRRLDRLRHRHRRSRLCPSCSRLECGLGGERQHL